MKRAAGTALSVIVVLFGHNKSLRNHRDTRTLEHYPIHGVKFRGLPATEHFRATSPVHARPVEPRTFQFDSRGCPVRRHLRPRAEKAGRISSNRLLQLAEVKRLPRAKNEIWYQRIPDPQQRPEGDQGS